MDRKAALAQQEETALSRTLGAQTTPRPRWVECTATGRESRARRHAGSVLSCLHSPHGLRTLYPATPAQHSATHASCTALGTLARRRTSTAPGHARPANTRAGRPCSQAVHCLAGSKPGTWPPKARQITGRSQTRSSVHSRAGPPGLGLVAHAHGTLHTVPHALYAVPGQLSGWSPMCMAHCSLPRGLCALRLAQHGPPVLGMVAHVQGKLYAAPRAQYAAPGQAGPTSSRVAALSPATQAQHTAPGQAGERHAEMRRCASVMPSSHDGALPSHATLTAKECGHWPWQRKGCIRPTKAPCPPRRRLRRAREAGQRPTRQQKQREELSSAKAEPARPHDVQRF